LISVDSFLPFFASENQENGSLFKAARKKHERTTLEVVKINSSRLAQYRWHSMITPQASPLMLENACGLGYYLVD
jgi:hypothetical protein